jgi:hypothetical protein
MLRVDAKDNNNIVLPQRDGSDFFDPLATYVARVSPGKQLHLDTCEI